MYQNFYKCTLPYKNRTQEGDSSQQNYLIIYKISVNGSNKSIIFTQNVFFVMQRNERHKIIIEYEGFIFHALVHICFSFKKASIYLNSPFKIDEYRGSFCPNIIMTLDMIKNFWLDLQIIDFTSNYYLCSSLFIFMAYFKTLSKTLFYSQLFLQGKSFYFCLQLIYIYLTPSHLCPEIKA